MALCHCSLQTVHRRGSRKFQFVQDCKRTGCRQGRCSLASRTDYWIKRAESVLRWDFAQWKMGSNCSTLHRRLLWHANVLQTVSYFSISPTDQVLLIGKILLPSNQNTDQQEVDTCTHILDSSTLPPAGTNQKFRGIVHIWEGDCAKISKHFLQKHSASGLFRVE